MFKNLVTLVNGGATTLGRATVNRFAKKGSQVILCDLPTSNGEEIAKEIGENVHFIPADSKLEKDTENVVNEIRKRFGQLNVLVNCSGLGLLPLIETGSSDVERFSNIVQANLCSTYNMIRLTAGIMGDNEPDENQLRGIMITTAGLNGIFNQKDQAAVAAASGSIIALTKVASCDLSHRGIRTVSIIPDVDDKSSAGYKHLLEDGSILRTNPNNNPDAFAHLVQTIVANAYINSTTIDLSGGLVQKIMN